MHNEVWHCPAQITTFVSSKFQKKYFCTNGTFTNVQVSPPISKTDQPLLSTCSATFTDSNRQDKIRNKETQHKRCPYPTVVMCQKSYDPTPADQLNICLCVMWDESAGHTSATLKRSSAASSLINCYILFFSHQSGLSHFIWLNFIIIILEVRWQSAPRVGKTAVRSTSRMCTGGWLKCVMISACLAFKARPADMLKLTNYNGCTGKYLKSQL